MFFGSALFSVRRSRARQDLNQAGFLVRKPRVGHVLC